MDLSTDLYNDLQRDGTPKPGMPSVEAVNIVQQHEAVLETLKEAILHLETLNDDICTLLHDIPPTISAIKSLIKDVRLGITPEAKNSLKQQCALLAKLMADDINIVIATFNILIWHIQPSLAAFGPCTCSQSSPSQPPSPSSAISALPIPTPKEGAANSQLPLKPLYRGSERIVHPLPLTTKHLSRSIYEGGVPTTTP